MRLNETRKVLWHESCKCICKLKTVMQVLANVTVISCVNQDNI